MSPLEPDDNSHLRRLARLLGVQPDHIDSAGRAVAASTETLLAVLRAMGVDISSAADAGSAYDRARREVWDWRLEPVTVAWDGAGAGVLRMPADEAHLRIDCNMRLEDADGHSWGVNLTDVPPFASEVIDGEVYVAKLLPFRRLPFGYHKFYVDLAGHHTEAHVISAPMRVYASSEAPVDLGRGEAPAADLAASLEPDEDARSDASKYGQTFVAGVSLATPSVAPDSHSTVSGGPPLHPGELRRTGYEYFIARLRRHFETAGVLSIADAVALFERYWVPEGADVDDGVWVRYEASEQLAVTCIESHRAASPVVLRNTSELPDEVAAALESHGIARPPPADSPVAQEHPNWSRVADYAIEDFDSVPLLNETLDMLRTLRPKSSG